MVNCQQIGDFFNANILTIVTYVHLLMFMFGHYVIIDKIYIGVRMITLNRRFGTVDGNTAMLFRIQNNRGMTFSATNYGAAITGLTAPDKNGKMGDVVLG